MSLLVCGPCHILLPQILPLSLAAHLYSVCDMKSFCKIPNNEIFINIDLLLQFLSETIARLNPENVLITLRSKLLGEFTKDNCQVEKWFGAKYRLEGEPKLFSRISEIETPFGKRILIKKRKIKEQMKIILAQFFEIFQISSSGKIYNKTLWNNKIINIME